MFHSKRVHLSDERRKSKIVKFKYLAFFAKQKGRTTIWTAKVGSKFGQPNGNFHFPREKELVDHITVVVVFNRLFTIGRELTKVLIVAPEATIT